MTDKQKAATRRFKAGNSAEKIYLRQFKKEGMSDSESNTEVKDGKPEQVLHVACSTWRSDEFNRLLAIVDDIAADCDLQNADNPMYRQNALEICLVEFISQQLDSFQFSCFIRGGFKLFVKCKYMLTTLGISACLTKKINELHHFDPVIDERDFVCKGKADGGRGSFLQIETDKLREASRHSEIKKE
ncbi:hypothetical protein PHYBLDRAFT_152783 [Phycomyces blakesleeanus NRRL 1555(-)]|uniref:Uncharacterized protein n=1 Tax=Phycomyces blakesleeanus (strain ATCC 8743b / DSM 1359 / FGSC 10004 / NBRC 33097 / NRRL 1555) TaxID=763407 RepID=A0A162ZED2_PHYB8|nr:hypothetical protein PHYBLDRAFT_152783 [Phycomyces blakesleeanus NRRL 1555(-)]OAD66211.1 hypothetical protein PHYBLDRAFT_152783 [Phycomyces blakesleeanus NRRL 1555(-)]|eukprot:XP_018284251.1 hypothetical protein PHYBLDRAFT_152783 [Phycomyces blakesleeanus NRRL 1555(-)]